MNYLRSGFIGLALLVFSAVPASAVSFGFDCITNNLAGDCAIGEAQLVLDITDEGPGQVRFTFSNTGPAQSVISEIYFDDGALLSLASVFNSAGTLFTQGADPPNLPGANNASPPFQVTSGFLAEAVPSPSMNGVGVGESVAIVFDLFPGFDFNDVIDQFNDGTVRAGVHVISFGSGGSESLITPEPGTAMMVLAGLGILGLRRRR